MESMHDLIFSRAKRIVNAHAHFDRAYTLTPAMLQAYPSLTLEDKWSYVDTLKRESTIEDYEQRILKAVRQMQAQGVRISLTFIDVDPVVKDKALKAALRVKENVGKEGFTLLLANQALKGVLTPEAWEWYAFAAEHVDVLGALPRVDALRVPNGGVEHLTRVFTLAKKLGKPVHVHTDQLNDPEERETELVAELVASHGLQGRVAVIHAISLAAKPRQERVRVYEKLRDARVSVIACPFAWIDTPRSEKLMPFHNALTPVDELLAFDIPIAIGTDNIADIYLPFTTGSLWEEIHLLASGTRLHDPSILARILEARGVAGIPQDD